MPKSTEQFDVALIDVDSLVYSVAWTTINKRAAEKKLVLAVESIIEDLDSPSNVYVFVKGKDNFRYGVDPEYKAHRRTVLQPDVADRVSDLYEFAQGEFIASDGGEADDYCSIYAYKAMEEGLKPVVCHIDKDLNMIPGWHWNFKKKELYYTSPQDSFVFMSLQLLTGDAADNIPGIWGIGPNKAENILQNKFLHEFKDRILTQWRDINLNNKGQPQIGSVRYKDWENRFYKSANCLIIRESLDELRELSKEEIQHKMSWNATHERYMKGITFNEALIANSISLRLSDLKTGKVIPDEVKECPEEVLLSENHGDSDIGSGEVLTDQTSPSSPRRGRPKGSTASSTKSKSTTTRAATSATSGRKPSTATRGQGASAKATGKRTRVLRKK